MSKKNLLLTGIVLGFLLYGTRSLNTYPIHSFFSDGNLWWFGNITQFANLIENPFSPFPDTLKAGDKSGLIAFGSGSNQPWNLILKTLARWSKWCGESSFMVCVFPGLCAYFFGGWLLFVRILNTTSFASRSLSFLVYSLLPMGANISRSIIPEAYAIMFLVIYLYFLNQVLDSENKINVCFLIISSFVSAYFFPKNSIILLILTLTLGFYQKMHRKNPTLIWITSIFFIWCLVCKFIYTKNNWTAGHSDQILVKQILISQEFWLGWYKILIDNYKGIFVLLSLSIVFSPKTSFLPWYIFGLSTGYIALGLFFSYHTYTHSYYSYPLIIVIPLCWTVIMEYTFRKVSNITKKTIVKYIVTSAFFSTIVFLYGPKYIEIINERNNNINKTKEIKERYSTIDKETNKSKKVIFFTVADGTYFQVFCQSDGFGWPGFSNYTGEKAIGNWKNTSFEEYQKYWFDKFLTQGAEFFVTDKIDDFKNQTFVYKKLNNNYKIIFKTSDLLIFSLK